MENSPGDPRRPRRPSSCAWMPPRPRPTTSRTATRAGTAGRRAGSRCRRRPPRLASGEGGGGLVAPPAVRQAPAPDGRPSWRPRQHSSHFARQQYSPPPHPPPWATASINHHPLTHTTQLTQPYRPSFNLSSTNTQPIILPYYLLCYIIYYTTATQHLYSPSPFLQPTPTYYNFPTHPTQSINFPTPNLC